MEDSDFLTSIPPRFVSFAWRYQCSRTSASGCSQRPRARRLITRVLTPGILETSGSPRFLGSPSSCMPRSQTPEGSTTQGHQVWRMMPSVNRKPSAPSIGSFRGSITRPARSLSTLHRTGYPDTAQDSLLGGRPPLPRRASHPLGFIERFRLTERLLLSQAWPGVPGAELTTNPDSISSSMARLTPDPDKQPSPSPRTRTSAVQFAGRQQRAPAAPMELPVRPC